MKLRFRRMMGGRVIPEDEETQEALMKYKVGDILEADFKRKRNPGFHRKFFAMLNYAYEHWEPQNLSGQPLQKNRDQFRSDVTVMAGYYDQVFDISGEMRLRPKSISFANMSQEDFEKLYSNVVDVILMHVLNQYTRKDLDRVVKQLISGYA